MTPSRDADLIYRPSDQAAAALVELSPGPPLKIRLPQRPQGAPAWAGYRLLPTADCAPEGADEAARALAGGPLATLHPLSRWDTPPFTPHRRHVIAALGTAEAEEGAGWITPAEALAGWREGRILLDTPTTILLHSLAGVPEGADATALVHRLRSALQEADRRLPGGEASLAHLPHEVRPGIRLLPLHTPTLPPATHTNCYVIGDAELLVVDPASPWPADQARLDALLGALEAEGRRIKAIVLTHHHWDHVGGAVAAARRWGAPIWAHAVTADLLRGEIPVHRTLAEGERLPLAGASPLELRCFHTPGHAAGHLCLWEAQTATLIAGDMIAGWGTIVVDPGEGDLSLYLHHLERLAALGARAVVPAHGPALADGPRALGGLIRHRLAREGQLLDALAGGPASPASLTGQVYADVPPWIVPVAQASVLAHLIKLEAEGRVSAGLDGRVALIHPSP